MQSSPAKNLSWIAALAAAYFVTGKLGLQLAFVNASATAVWPPSGIALAALLLLGARVWPGIWLGAFLVNITTSGSLLATIGIATGNTLEPLLGAVLVERFARGRRAFQQAVDCLRFMGLAAILATGVSATCGVVSLSLFEPDTLPAWWPVWLTWWLGDMVSVAILTPLLVIWASPGEPLATGVRRLEGLALFAALTFAGAVVFVPTTFANPAREPLSFLCFPLLLWGAFRFGQRGAIGAVFVLSVVAIWGTLRGVGPFASVDTNESLLLLQAFMATITVTNLVLGAVVAERARSARALADSERRLADADRRKDEFLAILAHELRNPLAPIRTAVDVLRRIPMPTPEIAKLRDIIDRQVAQMARLLDDLLDVSRITSGKISLRRGRVALGDVLHAAVETTRPLLDAHQHRFVIAVDEPLWVDADPARLAQVFSNLLNNAAKYTPRAGRIELTAVREGSAAVVRLRDNGIGIESARLPLVFELFVQGEQAPGQTRDGLGVGLSLARRLIEMHGGSIAATSAGRDQGTEFVVRLPLQPGPAPRDDGAAAPVAATRAPLRILVADDNVDAANLMEHCLRMLGHETIAAHDGAAALRAAETFRPDVALLDIGMPEMDGYDVARRLRQQTVGARMLLVAVSGWGQDTDKQRAADAGFDEHLTKPAEFADIENLLRRCAAKG